MYWHWECLSKIFYYWWRQSVPFESEPLATISSITQRCGWFWVVEFETGDDHGEIQTYRFSKVLRHESFCSLKVQWNKETKGKQKLCSRRYNKTETSQRSRKDDQLCSICSRETIQFNSLETSVWYRPKKGDENVSSLSESISQLGQGLLI